MSARVAGVSVAPATPSSARVRISISALDEYAVTTETSAKAVAPQSKSFL